MFAQARAFFLRASLRPRRLSFAFTVLVLPAAIENFALAYDLRFDFFDLREEVARLRFSSLTIPRQRLVWVQRIRKLARRLRTRTVVLRRRTVSVARRVEPGAAPGVPGGHPAIAAARARRATAAPHDCQVAFSSKVVPPAPPPSTRGVSVALGPCAGSKQC